MKRFLKLIDDEMVIFRVELRMFCLHAASLDFNQTVDFFGSRIFVETVTILKCLQGLQHNYEMFCWVD